MIELRRAEASDTTVVTQIAGAVFDHYTARIGHPPSIVGDDSPRPPSVVACTFITQ